MTVYEALINEDKQPSCGPRNPYCEEPCDEPSFWDSLPQCRLNWIALGLAALAIGFGLIGLGYINIGTTITVANATNSNTIPITFDPTYLTQGSLLIATFLGIIGVSAWILFKPCSDDWKIVVVGSLVGASGFSLAAIGLLYFTVARFSAVDPTFDPTWFNIARPLIIASIVGFLLLAYLIYANRCYGCITAKKAVIVSLIFLSGGWAAWSLGRLLDIAVITFEYSTSTTPPPPTGYVFPSSAFMAFIAVSIINIVLVVALGWYVLRCAADNCFTVFLPLFASAAPLGNWALYRVGLNVLSYVGGVFGVPPPFPTAPALPPPLIQFAYAVGFVSITALLLTFVIANGAGDAFIVAAASASPLLYPIATYTYVATANSLLIATTPDFVTSILQGIFSGIALTAILGFFLRCKAQCPIPKIIYGLASGIFGWAVIYLYSTYSADILDFTSPTITTLATLNVGLSVIISVAVIAVLYVQFVVCDELLGAITFANIALLTVGAAGFTGTIAYYQEGSVGIPTTALNPPDIRAATMIYVAYALTALFLPLLFVKCGGIKRQVVLAIASLAFGIAAIDFGRAVAFARAVAFSDSYVSITNSTSSLTYIFSAFGAVLAGQAIVWAYPQANIYTALIASFIALAAAGIAQQISFLVDAFNSGPQPSNLALIGTPWLVFTLALVALLVFLEFKSLCIPQHCRFLFGLLIPVLGIAVCGKFFGASAVLGVAYNIGMITSGYSYLLALSYTSRLILVNSIVPLACFFVSLQAFNCTSCLAYLPSSIAYSAVIYVASQFQLPDINFVLSVSHVHGGAATLPPFLNVLTSIYYNFNLTIPSTDTTIISDNATFFTQVSLVYILFLAPALITGFVFSCSRHVSAAVIGASIAAAAISFGAFGVANVISGVIRGIAGSTGFIPDITTFISFTNFLTGINSQLILLAVGVLTVLFISFDKCSYRSC